MSKQLLIIFARNPELGKVKTRLAKDTSDATALEVYKDLIDHTHRITTNLEVDKWVFYTDKIEFNDIWEHGDYMKMIQAEGDLGNKMMQASAKGFAAGYFEVVIIGSDIDTLSQEMIEDAFEQVQQQTVIGPAEDGGYYLLGLNEPRKDIFENKIWGTDTVLGDTLVDLANEEVFLLDELNDIDYLSDIEEDSFLYPLISKFKK